MVAGTGVSENGLMHQIHAWGGEGDDILRMVMPQSGDEGVYFGHHVRGDQEAMERAALQTLIWVVPNHDIRLVVAERFESVTSINLPYDKIMIDA
jgi:hypothetical protein